MYNKILGLAERFSLYAVWLGGAMILFVAFMVTFDVLIRNIFNVTLGGADEISGYLFAIATAWSLPYALIHRANVRIDALYILLSSRWRVVLDLFGLTLLGFFIGLLTWRGLAMWLESYSRNIMSVTPLHVPLKLPQGLWGLGLLLVCVCVLLLLYGAISAIFRGDLKRVHKLIGAPSIQEEIEEEGLDLDAIKRQKN